MIYNMNLARWANAAIAITPANGAPITDANGNVIQPLLFVGGVGNVVVMTATGQSVTFTGVTAGTLLPVMVSQVQSTGTTATAIIGIYQM